MLAIGYQMGYHLPRTPEQRGMRPSDICLENVSSFCESKRSSIHKPLNDMTYKELVKAVTQFEIIYAKFLAEY